MHKIDGLDYVTLSEASSMFDVDGLVDRVREGAVRFAYLKHGSSRNIVLCLTDLHAVLKSVPESKSASENPVGTTGGTSTKIGRAVTSSVRDVLVGGAAGLATAAALGQTPWQGGNSYVEGMLGNHKWFEFDEYLAANKHDKKVRFEVYRTGVGSIQRGLSWGEETIVIDGVSRFWIGRLRVIEMLMDFGEVEDDMANVGGSAPLVMAALGPVTKYGGFLYVGLRFWHDRDQSPLDVSYGAQRGA